MDAEEVSMIQMHTTGGGEGRGGGGKGGGEGGGKGGGERGCCASF